MRSPFQYIPQANMPRLHGQSQNPSPTPTAAVAPPGRGEQGLTPAPTNTLETVANLEGRTNENGVRLPRDYATTQVLQTPNAISVHNTAVISHPTPKGLPGTNSYQVKLISLKS